MISETNMKASIACFLSGTSHLGEVGLTIRAVHRFPRREAEGSHAQDERYTTTLFVSHILAAWAC